MWYRQSRREFEARKGEGNRRSMQALVAAGEEPGLLAYAGGEPVGWCAVAPRERYPRLAGSRILKPVDGQPVWSVVCFFVRKDWRGRGVTRALLDAAVDFVRARGGRIVEGYPVEPKKGRLPDAFAYHGLATAFRKAGFREVARRSPTRPIMRRRLRPSR
ncbi:MAG: GNAT family N-acetyltransferase [Candidatus Krumholzibacteriota bacterium]|nr:GNAT family N-acetyltransferase [Candidatus Krumholzibacteriota bacterium]